MLKNLSNNLNLLMAKSRLSSSELAREVGVPATTIKRIRNNEQANATIATLLPIAKYFSVSLHELIGDELSFDFKIKANLRSIPLLSWHKCAEFLSKEHDTYPQVITERVVSSHAFSLQVEDHDLSYFSKGSILIIEPNIIPHSNDYVIVTNKSQKIAVIRQYIIEMEQIYLKPLRPELEMNKLTDQHRILGVVIQSKIELK